MKVGYLGEVHPQVCENYNIGDRVYYADIDMPYIVEHACFDKKYEGIAKFPTSTRDISLVVDKQVLIGTMENAIIKEGVHYKELKGTPEEEAKLKESYAHLCKLRDEVIGMGVLPPIKDWHSINPNID